MGIQGKTMAEKVISNIGKVIIGKEQTARLLLTALRTDMFCWKTFREQVKRHWRRHWRNLYRQTFPESSLLRICFQVI